MFEVDLHTHTLMSTCGIHSLIEMLTAAKNAGLKGLAVTDHGYLLGGKMPSTFFDRLVNPVEGIELFKGAELNLEGESSRTDIEERLIPFCDILLLGLHDTIPKDRGRDYNTGRLIEAIEKNPYIDGITHPNSTGFPVNYTPLAKTAAEYGVALELNNSKVKYRRVSDSETRELIRVCRDTGCPVMVNTDSHAMNELGDTSRIERMIREEDLPQTQIVNRTLETVKTWLDSRRKNKKR